MSHVDRRAHRGAVCAGLLIGFGLDRVLGDPVRRHPVAAFGRAAGWLERRIYADDRRRGVAFTVIAVGVPALAGLAVGRAARTSPALTVVLTAAATWTVLGGRSLTREANAVAARLAADDLPGARRQVARLVGRDTDDLDASAVARAAVESVAENSSDAVVAPLLWGAVAGLPGLLGYRALNTLDAMVGHRSARYERFGWAAARLDDLANWVPARIAAALAILLSPAVGGSPSQARRALAGRRRPSEPQRRTGRGGLRRRARRDPRRPQPLRRRGVRARHPRGRTAAGVGRHHSGQPAGRPRGRRRAPCVGGHPVGAPVTGAVLILGGTAEARELAVELAASGWSVVTALAGRVRDPALPVGEVRIGGFSTADLDGVAGLAAFLRERRIAAVVDATHPFAVTISAHAVAAADLTGVALLRLERPGWSDHPDARSWTWVASAEHAVVAGAAAKRPFLTTGRQSLEAFLGWADKQATLRVVDPPALPLPAGWRLIRSRGPYTYAGEHALLAEAGADLLVTKDSGGRPTAAKLDAARDLGVPVVVIRRPAGLPRSPDLPLRTRPPRRPVIPVALTGQNGGATGQAYWDHWHGAYGIEGSRRRQASESSQARCRAA